MTENEAENKESMANITPPPSVIPAQAGIQWHPEVIPGVYPHGHTHRGLASLEEHAEKPYSSIGKVSNQDWWRQELKGGWATWSLDSRVPLREG